MDSHDAQSKLRGEGGGSLVTTNTKKNPDKILVVVVSGGSPCQGVGEDHDVITSVQCNFCLLYTSPSPRDATLSRMPSSA